MHVRRSPSGAVGSFVAALSAIALVAIGCGPADDGRGALGERSESPAGCNPSPATRMPGGKTYVLHHFSFDAPAAWRADGAWWDDGASLDPANPQRRADIVVGLGEDEDRVDPSRVEVSEDPTRSTPDETLAAWKAGFAADHAPGCEATFDRTTFRCDVAVLRTVRCASGLGLLSSHHTRLAVFHAGETFTVACDVVGEADAETICDQVNASFAVGSAPGADALVVHDAKTISIATPSAWVDAGSRASFLKWRSDPSVDATVAAAFASPSATLADDVASWRSLVESEHQGEACSFDVAPVTFGGDDARRVHAHCSAAFDLSALVVMHDGRVFDASCTSHRNDAGACASIVSSLRLHP